MDLSQLEEKLSGFGPSGYYIFESFIIKILQAEATGRGQELIYNSGNGVSAYDAIAPNGFSEIQGTVFIEIIRSLSPNRIAKELQRYFSLTRDETDALLLISLENYQSDPKRFVKQHFPLAKNVIIWGPQEIQQLINRHLELAAELSDSLFSNRFKTALEAKKEDWREQRSTVLSAIRESYVSGRFSMLLGAGVSSSAGLPDWDTLLNSLFVSMLTEDGVGGRNADQEQIASIVKRLRHIDGPSALMLARYIRRGIAADSQAEQGKFISAVTAQLYGLRNKNYALSSPLIKAIASLCAPTRTGAKVKAVITYNFDDLLEREIKERGLYFRSIFEEVDLPSPEELPIYHVHGFLPEDRTGHQNINKATLVFSEEGYHQIYRDAYHWSNLIQLNSLKETTCVMVGLSLTDPNLRRLLEISAKSIDKPKHFAFIRRITLENFSKAGERSVVRAPQSVIRRFLDRHHKLNEEVLRELGVNIIWYEQYDEIPALLQNISKGI